MLIDRLAPTNNWNPNNDEDSPWGIKSEKVNGQTVHRRSKFAIRLQWIRNNYTSLGCNADAPTVMRYTRAYIMDLLGSVLFPDKSDDQVPVMYLQFLGDLNTRYNWGQAVLAFLYRQLSMAYSAKTKSMAGPLMLLQQWA